MTTVRFRPRRPDGSTLSGQFVNHAKIYAKPTRAFDVPEGVVMPVPVEISVDGSTVTKVFAPSSPTNWAWEFTEQYPDGLNGLLIVKSVRAVPDTGEVVDFEDLLQVDPRTFVPQANPESAWWTALNSAKAAVDQAGADQGTSRYALQWMREQCEPIVRPTTYSRLAAHREYPTGYTGQVKASFTVPAGSPTNTAGYITVSDPGDLASMPGWRGVIFGQVSGIANPQNYRVQAVKATDAYYPMGSAATPDANGYFAVDVTGVETWRKGPWGLMLVTPAAPSTPVGTVWPTENGRYSDLVVDLHSVTDDDYTVGTQVANLSGEVQFLFSANGAKHFVLRNEVSGAVLASTARRSGCIRSFQVASGQPGFGTRFPEQCFVYDQGVALCAAIAAGERELAHILIEGLAKLQTTSGAQAGGWRFSGRQQSAAYGDPSYRTGAHAIALFSALSYLQAFPEFSARVMPMITAGLTWMMAQRQTSGNRSGLFLGGIGTYVSDGGGGQIFQQDDNITWAATEHQIDCYFALKLAGKLLGGSHSSAADALASNMMSKLWNTELGRFNQGLRPDGADTADPLDVHSWGSIFLMAIGEQAKAIATMSDTQLAPFKVSRTAPNGKNVTGYATAYTSTGYPNMTPHVWWEGTFSVAYAMAKLGQWQRQRDTIIAARPGQFGDGSYPYVSNQDAVYELNTYHSVASTGWAVLAAVGAGIFDLGIPAGLPAYPMRDFPGQSGSAGSGSDEFVTTIGDGVRSVFTIEHPLVSTDLMVQVVSTSGGQTVFPVITRPTATTVMIDFATATPTSGQYKVLMSKVG